MDVRSAVLLGVCAAVGCRSATEVEAEVTNALTVMTFNVRYGTAKDGPNHWDRRRDQVVAAIRAHAPDLLATQEVLAFQADFLASELPDYAWVGHGRTDGAREGEASAIFVKRSRFRIAESGRFWLSSTPEVVGSVGWDAALARVATWAKLERVGGGPAIWFFDAHFDHVGAESRHASARLMKERVAALGDVPVIVAGDFNAGPDEPPYAVFTSTAAPVLTDAFLAVRGKEEGGTFHAFGELTIDARIDWIFCSRHFTPLAAEIDRRKWEGRYPSDHYPVVVKLE